MENKNKKIETEKFQFGISKTFKISLEEMWVFLLSENGISIWLGKINFDDFEINKLYKTSSGIEGKLTVLNLDSHMRLSWKPSHWKKSSIIEIRLTNSKGRARIIFHHTNLYEVENKIELKNYWSSVISNIENNFKK